MQQTITFVRHANAIPKEEDKPDIARPLTEKGRKQALERRRQLDNPAFDLVLFSPTMRTDETGSIVAGSFSSSDFIELPELYTPKGPDGEILDEMFSRLGYTPLESYYQEPAESIECLERFARKAWNAILIKIRRARAKNILVVGHAIYLPSIGYQVSVGEERQKVFQWNMPEGGAFQVFLEEGEFAELRILD